MHSKSFSGIRHCASFSCDREISRKQENDRHFQVADNKKTHIKVLTCPSILLQIFIEISILQKNLLTVSDFIWK